MIWQGICACGLKSRAYVVCGNMNAQVYTNECLQKRLLPFIRAHRCPCIFWPDLASCFDARTTLSWYEENGVNIVEKNINPPNCPEFRPIEKYWAIVKRKLHSNGKAMTTAAQMLLKWNHFAGKVQKVVVQRLMATISKNVRKFLRSPAQS
jgi:hypothetical protein